MDLAAVMDEIGDRLDTITGLRVYRYPPDNVHPPAAVVSYPETYEFDGAMARGMDRIDLPVIVLVGRVSDRASRDRIAAYVAGSGPRSVKAVVEGAESYSALHTVRVQGVDFDVVSVAGVDHLAATFTLDIAGPGGT